MSTGTEYCAVQLTPQLHSYPVIRCITPKYNPQRIRTIISACRTPMTPATTLTDGVALSSKARNANLNPKPLTASSVKRSKYTIKTRAQVGADVKRKGPHTPPPTNTI